MTRWLVLYEDPHAADLSPLTDLTPVAALTFGASTLGRRWRDIAGVPLLATPARPGLVEAWHARPVPELHQPPAADDDVLVINAAALPGPWFDTLLAARAPALFTSAGRIAGARAPYRLIAGGLAPGDAFEPHLLSQRLSGTPVDATLLAWPWDLVRHNPEAIEQDLLGETGHFEGDIHDDAVMDHPERVKVERDAQIDALAVLDARNGPILVRAGAHIASGTVVVGPCVIGEATELLGGAVTRSTFGPECRVAGEVEDSVWQGYANKRHHGFVGHSWVGEWVNLGALTTTSDLKNNYGAVRAWAAGALRETGQTKLGALIGAHVKTGIGSLLPTGASLGTGSNLFGGGRFVPKRVAAFAWWDGERAVEHRLDEFLDTARIAMSRRGRSLETADERVLRAIFEASRQERGAAVTRP